MSAEQEPSVARVSIAPDAARSLIRVQAFEGQVTPLWRVPLEIIINGNHLRCQSHQLPLRSESLRHIDMENALEFVIDDARLLREAHRVLIPGGTLEVAVPNNAGFGVVDAFNAFRYVVDVTGRGPELPEIAETGWRRHYSRTELERALREAGFALDGSASSGIGGSELGLAVQLCRRWLGNSGPAFKDDGASSASISHRLERTLPAFLGARLHVRAHKPVEP